MKHPENELSEARARKLQLDKSDFHTRLITATKTKMKLNSGIPSPRKKKKAPIVKPRP